jgi:hypothetical protein
VLEIAQGIDAESLMNIKLRPPGVFRSDRVDDPCDYLTNIYANQVCSTVNRINIHGCALIG